jgi:hypothetical protein
VGLLGVPHPAGPTWPAGAITDEPAWLEASTSGTAIMAAERVTPSARLICLSLEEPIRAPPVIRLCKEMRKGP